MGEKVFAKGLNYKCPECPGESFPSKWDLRRHREECHDGFKEARTEWRCDVPGCKYVGRCRQSLWCHKKVHSNEKPYKCDQCDYACKLKTNLIIHKATVILNLILALDKKYPLTAKSYNREQANTCRRNLQMSSV